MLVVTRYDVPADEAEEFLALGRAALAALTARSGCVGGSLSRNVDDPSVWALTTSWTSVGAYRRALSAHEVKMHAVPLMYRARDEPTAFEYLVTADPGGVLHDHASSRAPDADTVGPRRADRRRGVPPDR